MIRIKRVYEAPTESDGFRLLVDRLWPRGMKLHEAQVDLWLQDLAPSAELRKWYGHDPARWEEFSRRYGEELGGKGDLLSEIRRLERQHEVVTLLFSARDARHSNAEALKEFLDAHAPPDVPQPPRKPRPPRGGHSL